MFCWKKFIGKIKIKLLTFIIIHKNSPSGFQTHDLLYRECCHLSLDQILVLRKPYIIYLFLPHLVFSAAQMLSSFF
jgi:hypothetical protein